MTTTPENESAQILRQAAVAEICVWSHVHAQWYHVPGPTVAPEDLMMPSYWAAVGNSVNLPESGQLRPGDLVVCEPADFSWYVELLVRDIDPEGVIMRVKSSAFFTDRVSPPGSSQRTPSSDVIYHWAGPLLKWQVLTPEGRVLKSGLATEGEAAAWFAEHRKMQQRTTKGAK